METRRHLPIVLLALSAVVTACTGEPPREAEAPPDFSASEEVMQPEQAAALQEEGAKRQNEPLAETIQPEAVDEDVPKSVKGLYNYERNQARASYESARQRCAEEKEDGTPEDCERKAKADYQARLTLARTRYESDRRKARN